MAILINHKIPKGILCFVCLSVFFFVNGAGSLTAEAGEKSIPIGQMVSIGDVKFEAKQNVWKNVEARQFPVFKGIKIKTEKGVSAIVLKNESQIEVGQKSLLLFSRDDELNLFHGGVGFRIPPTGQMGFRVGTLTVAIARPLQASSDPATISIKNEETIGGICVHSSGGMTVRSIQGNLSVLDQNRIVLASLPANNALTLPPAIVSGKERVMVAQAGDAEEEARCAEVFPFVGSSERYSGVGLGGSILLNLAGMSAIIGQEHEPEDDRPICK